MKIYLRCIGCGKDDCLFSASIFESDKKLFCLPKYDHVNCKESEIDWTEITKEEFEKLKNEF